MRSVISGNRSKSVKPTLNNWSQLLPITCIVDNRSLYDAIKSTKSVAEKRLRLEITNIKELVNNGQIKNITWCSTIAKNPQ